MAGITESSIERHALSLFKKQAYTYFPGPSIAPDSDTPARQSFEEVLLLDRLREAVAKINSTLPADTREEAIKQIQRLSSTELIANNEAFHRLLTEGINVTYQKNGQSRGDIVRLVDFNNPENNDFVAVNQFTVISNAITGHEMNKRPDIILFINGIPLIVIELKNAADENTTIHSAFKQLQTYKQSIPQLFAYNAFSIISDGLEAKAGTISSDFSRFMAWKTSDGKGEASPLIGQLETLIKGMLDKKILLDLIRHFIVFEETSKEDKSGQIFKTNTKKLAAYHQYYAVNKAVESTLRASGYTGKTKKGFITNAPGKHGFLSSSTQPAGDRKGGVVWHTQGSGKSLSMVFYAGKIVLAMDNPTVVVITDRNDLDDQLYETFSSSVQLLRQKPEQAESRVHLQRLLKVSSGGIVFTTLQKFFPEEGNIHELLSDRSNIVVIADEAHRAHYGFKARTVDDTDEAGKVIGKKTVYGLAKYLRDALPHATYLGFTGTPVEKADRNTPAVFGNYVDVYDIAQSVNDGATVRIYYESRLAKINLSAEGRKLIQELDDELGEDDLTETQKAKAKWTQLEALIGSADRIKHIARDIVEHFTERTKAMKGKGMIVAMSRRIAAELYAQIIALKPEWHSDDLRRGAIKVVMTSASADGPEICKHHTSKEQRRTLAERMKNPDDPLRLVIVRDMWLTGFDVPCLHTLYIDKPMKGHNLMQAIARVNRVWEDKTGGLIVDYLGIASDLKEALSFYSDAGGKGEPMVAQEKAVQLMLEKLEVVSQMFEGFNFEDYFKADTGRKLALILEAEEHILGIENGRKRFIDEVNVLSQAFSIAIPHDEAMDAKDEIGFYQAVKARLVKFDRAETGRTDEELETVIRQVVDQALVTDKVIDIFDAAGIKKPDISVLSEEFLLEVKNMEHKNIALEVLRKLINEEIKSRSRTNLVQGRTLMEMLENSIQRYHNKILSAAEVIDELIKLSAEIRDMDKEPKELGLSTEEFAFYTAIADNQSARDVMGKDKLRELAVVIYQKVRENASIDWTIKESVKAKLKVIVKRTLRQFGYPPDMQKLATDTVLRQAEMIARELAG